MVLPSPPFLDRFGSVVRSGMLQLALPHECSEDRLIDRVIYGRVHLLEQIGQHESHNKASSPSTISTLIGGVIPFETLLLKPPPGPFGSRLNAFLGFFGTVGSGTTGLGVVDAPAAIEEVALIGTSVITEVEDAVGASLKGGVVA